MSDSKASVTIITSVCHQHQQRSAHSGQATRQCPLLAVEETLVRGRKVVALASYLVCHQTLALACLHSHIDRSFP